MNCGGMISWRGAPPANTSRAAARPIDRGERRITPGSLRDVVVADDGEIPRDRLPAPARLLDDCNALLNAHRQDRGRVRRRVEDHRGGVSVPRVRLDHRNVADGDSGFRQRLRIAEVLVLVGRHAGGLGRPRFPRGMQLRRRRTPHEGDDAEPAVAEPGEVLGRHVGAGASVDPHRTDARSRVEIDHGKGQATKPRRLNLTEMSRTAENEAVDQGVLDAVIVRAVGNDDEIGADLVANLPHAHENLAVDRITERVRHPPAAGRQDGDRVELPVAEQTALRIRTEIAELARGGLDPLAELGPYHVGIVEHIRSRAAGYAGGSCNVDQSRHDSCLPRGSGIPRPIHMDRSKKVWTDPSSPLTPLG
jgi:hypothetical protein